MIRVIVECDVQSRVVDCLVERKRSSQTCCAVSSSLLAHAPRVIAGCEAARTMYPGVSQENAAKQSLVCQYQGGSGARLDGKVNSGEPVINLVKRNRLKVLISLNQNGVRRVVPFSHRNTRTLAPSGNSRNLRHRVNDTKHGKPVLLPCEWQANRKEG